MTGRYKQNPGHNQKKSAKRHTIAPYHYRNTGRLFN